MLARQYRFHGHGSLRYVYRNGRTVRSSLMVVKYINNPRRKNSRFSIVVSKKVLKSAVGRNRIRRRLYEIIRRQLPHMQHAVDIVVIVVSADVRDIAADELERATIDLFKQADIYKVMPPSDILVEQE